MNGTDRLMTVGKKLLLLNDFLSKPPQPDRLLLVYQALLADPRLQFEALLESAAALFDRDDSGNRPESPLNPASAPLWHSAASAPGGLAPERVQGLQGHPSSHPHPISESGASDSRLEPIPGSRPATPKHTSGKGFRAPGWQALDLRLPTGQPAPDAVPAFVRQPSNRQGSPHAAAAPGAAHPLPPTRQLAEVQASSSAVAPAGRIGPPAPSRADEAPAAVRWEGAVDGGMAAPATHLSRGGVRLLSILQSQPTADSTQAQAAELQGGSDPARAMPRDLFAATEPRAEMTEAVKAKPRLSAPEWTGKAIVSEPALASSANRAPGKAEKAAQTANRASSEDPERLIEELEDRLELSMMRTYGTSGG